MSYLTYDEYLWRDYQLWELDGRNCRLVTGMEYHELRDFASFYQNPRWNGRQDQNAPYWDKILELDAREVWTKGFQVVLSEKFERSLQTFQDRGDICTTQSFSTTRQER